MLQGRRPSIAARYARRRIAGSFVESRCARPLVRRSLRTDGRHRATKRPVEVSITRVAIGERVWFTAILRDMTERKKQQALLTHQATHDALTGLPNRVLLSRALDALSTSTPTALFMLDLDRFKDVNDTLGHATGDAVLTILGQRLRGALSEQNLIARIGGDEFAVVMPHYTDIIDLHALADDLLERVRCTDQNRHQHDRGRREHRRCAVSRTRRRRRRAAAASGRGDVRREEQPHERRVLQRRSGPQLASAISKITGALSGAIANEELELYYQPKVRLSDLKCVGVEALARWTQPELGDVSPGEFIPLAEESDLIVPLTRWSRGARARRTARRGARAGLDLGMAVNLSARHLRDTAFAQELLREIESARYRPEPRRTRNHRNGVDERSAKRRWPCCSVLTRAGVEDRDGRFRHRVLVARVSEAPESPHAEDRPQLRQRHRQQRERSDDRALDTADGARPRFDRRRRRHRGARALRDAARTRLRHRPGLLDRQADAGRQTAGVVEAWERGRPLQLPPMQAAG